MVGVIAFPTLGAGLLGPAAFAAMTFLEGHFLTPVIVGRRLQLNALAVFIALAFWTWLWGPMGAFLSSPLLIVALIIKEHLMPDRFAAAAGVTRVRFGELPARRGVCALHRSGPRGAFDVAWRRRNADGHGEPVT